MSSNDELLYKLYAPFSQVYEKPKAGRMLRFITARMAMNRLDEVVGPSNWRDDFTVQDGKVFCHLTIKLPDGTEITRCDTGEAGEGTDADGDKSVSSDAFKRAAAKFGIARYLYQDGVPKGAMAYFENGHRDLANPTRQSQSTNPAPIPGTNLQPAKWAPNYNCPKSGRALFAWMMDRQKEFSAPPKNFKFDILAAVNKQFPGRFTDWDQDQVQQAYKFMVDIWGQHGVWPNVGSEDGYTSRETTENISVVQQPDIQPAPTPEIMELKKTLRDQVVELIMLENNLDNPELVKYQDFLRRVNKIGKSKQIHIENWVQYRHKDNLVQLNSDVYDTINEFKSAKANLVDVGDEDLPF